MKSEPLGSGISRVEVTAILPGGLQLLVGERSLFLPFDEFPWFKDASVSAVLRVERPADHHLYWPALDIDLHVDSIEHPERFPLKSRGVPVNRKALQQTGPGHR